MSRLRLCLLGVLLFVGPLDSPADEAHQPQLPIAARKPTATKSNLPSQPRHVPVDTIESLTARVRKSVVVISFYGRNGKQQGLGSGFIVSSDGLIATNLHVIGEARPISVKTADGRRYDVTQIHATERSMDLAVLRIDAKNLPALELGNSDKLKQGVPIVAIGNPQGLQHSVVSGVVSARRTIDGKPMIQVAIPIEQGNSGGPVLDMQGRVQGILTLKSIVTENLGFAVAVNALKPLLKKPNPVPMSRWLTIGALDKKEWTPLFDARWRQRAGRIIVEGRGSGFGGRSLSLSTTKPPALPFEATVAVRLKNERGAAGLVFHSDGNNKHYGFYPSNGRLRLSRFDGPDVYSWNVLKEVSSREYVPGEWNRLKVRVEKNKIQCFVNDELVIESNDARYNSGSVGLAKFRDTRAEFKRFQIGRQIPSQKSPADLTERISKLAAKVPLTRPPTPDIINKLLPESNASARVLRNEARVLEQRAKRLRQLAAQLHQQKLREELAALLKKEDKDVDLVHAALLIAGIDNDELDIDVYMKQIERLVEELSQTFPKDADEKTRLAALNTFLFKGLGFHGSRTNYYNRSNSYLNEVIDDREGLPITLSVLYLGLAHRIGLNVVGVGLPGHFVVRYEPKEGEGQLIDPFEGGITLTRIQAAAKVLALGRGALEDEHLKAQTKRAILLRMLANLMAVAREQSDSEGMLRYVETMTVLEPDSARNRMMRAVLRFQTDRIEEAVEDTDWLLKHEPEEINIEQVRRLRRTLEDAKR